MLPRMTICVKTTDWLLLAHMTVLLSRANSNDPMDAAVNWAEEARTSLVRPEYFGPSFEWVELQVEP